MSMKINTKQIGDDFNTFGMMTERCIKLFLRDKMNVFFAMLAPLIVLILYVLFLSDMQIDSVKMMISAIAPNGVTVDDNVLKGMVDSWMMAGVIAVAMITVSLSANSVMVADKTRGVLADGIASPAKQWVLQLSYYFFNFIITLTLVLITSIICFIYLSATGSFNMSVGEVFGIFGIIILGVLSATSITVFISSFIKSEAVLGAVSGILGASIGFLIGAYMPMSIMPDFAKYLSVMVPGSHAGGILRNLFMTGSIEEIANILADGSSVEVVNNIVSQLELQYDLKMNAFGNMIGVSQMFIVLGSTTVGMIGINFLSKFIKKRIDIVKKTKARAKMLADIDTIVAP